MSRPHEKTDQENASEGLRLGLCDYCGHKNSDELVACEECGTFKDITYYKKNYWPPVSWFRYLSTEWVHRGNVDSTESPRLEVPFSEQPVEPSLQKSTKWKVFWKTRCARGIANRAPFSYFLPISFLIRLCRLRRWHTCSERARRLVISRCDYVYQVKNSASLSLRTFHSRIF